MAVELLAFDLDDTLLSDDLTICAENILAVRHAHELGVKVVPASGRATRSMQRYVDQLGVADAMISTNGAQLFCPLDTRIGFTPVPLALAREMAHLAQELGEYLQCYDAWNYHYNRAAPCDESRLYASLAGIEGEPVGDLAAYLTQEPAKLLFVQTDPQRMAALTRQVHSRFDGRLSIAFSKPFYLEITHPLATKGAALRQLAQTWNIPREAVMAIGDSGNDLSMLEFAGVSVAMGNARPGIQSRARFVTADNGHAGVAQAIRRQIG